MVFEQRYGLLGGQRDDYLAALIASTIAAVNSAKGKAPPLSDFIPRWEEMARGDDT